MKDIDNVNTLVRLVFEIAFEKMELLMKLLKTFKKTFCKQENHISFNVE